MAKKIMSKQLTATQFVRRLKMLQSDVELKKIQRYFKTDAGERTEDLFLGVKMGSLFSLAVEFAELPIKEIEKLLDSKIHEVRAGGVSVMDKASRNKKTSEGRRKEFFDLYMRRHDRINNWDLVDLGCLHMTGSYLFDKSRRILYRMAKSKNMWERRSAILSTCYFIRQGDLDDTYHLAKILLNEKEDLVNKATGWMVRFAGDKDRRRLQAFLDTYAATMPRIFLRNAIEKLDSNKRTYYLQLKNLP